MRWGKWEHGTPVLPSSLMKYKQTIISFAHYYDLKLRGDRILRLDGAPVREDRIPTQVELRKLFENAS
ncbi:MAG: hypothetical protein QG670_748, partial [Thermoproteota archaeon]|nr:hypothetical protein [Thermoproteota archaeon]